MAKVGEKKAQEVLERVEGERGFARLWPFRILCRAVMPADLIKEFRVQVKCAAGAVEIHTTYRTGIMQRTTRISLASHY